MVPPLGCYLRSSSETTWLNGGNAQVQNCFYISSVFPRDNFSVNGKNMMSDNRLRLRVKSSGVVSYLMCGFKSKMVTKYRNIEDNQNSMAINFYTCLLKRLDYLA